VRGLDQRLRGLLGQHLDHRRDAGRLTALVPAAAELRALRNLVGALPDRMARGSRLGVELGTRYHVTTFGILGYALISSRTVLDAMNLALRFLDLSFAFSAPVAAVLSQKPAQALIDAAHRHEGRVIVVGTRGESPLRGAVLGSVSHKLLHLSDRPVLCVPAEESA